MLNQIQVALKKSDLFWHNLAKTNTKNTLNTAVNNMGQLALETVRWACN